MVVEDKVIVEVKSVELLASVHKKQLLTYLRLADKRLGLLINFQVALIKDGITRIVTPGAPLLARTRAHAASSTSRR
jgi:GxxExxY protein